MEGAGRGPSIVSDLRRDVERLLLAEGRTAVQPTASESSFVAGKQGAEAYSVWMPVYVDLATLQSEVSSWSKPSLTVIQGTPLGEASSRSNYPHPMFVKGGNSIVEIYVDPTRSPVMQDLFDAILCLGSPSELTWSQLSPALSSDPEYIKMRSSRLAWTGIPGVD